MFFTVYLRHKPDGTYSNNVFNYETEDEANHQFYATMSTYGMDSTYDYVRCFTMDENGAVIKNDYSDHRAPSEPTDE